MVRRYIPAAIPPEALNEDIPLVRCPVAWYHLVHHPSPSRYFSGQETFVQDGIPSLDTRNLRRSPLNDRLAPDLVHSLDDA